MPHKAEEKRIRVWRKYPVRLSCLVFGLVLLGMSALAVPPAQAAPTLSRELRMTLEDQIPSETARQPVLEAVLRAVDGGYPEGGLTRIVERSLEEGVPSDDLAGMVLVLDKANRQGLPTQPYAQKIMEGLAKGVEGDRILAALGKVDQRMEFAAAQAARVRGTEGSSHLLVIRTGDALAAGMDRKDLERVYDVLAGKRVNRNIEPEDIMEMIKAASGYGVGSETVGDDAISLMKNPRADLQDVRRYLKRLADRAYRKHRTGGTASTGEGSSEAGDHHDDGDGEGGGDNSHGGGDGDD